MRYRELIEALQDLDEAETKVDQLAAEAGKATTDAAMPGNNAEALKVYRDRAYRKLEQARAASAAAHKSVLSIVHKLWPSTAKGTT